MVVTLPKVEKGLLQIDPPHKWNFSHTFFEKFKTKKVNKSTLKEREQAKIVDFKKEIQNSLGKIPAQSWVNL